MADLNVDDEWWHDEDGRRKALMEALRDVRPDPEWVVDGAALAAWKLARTYWKKGELIPEAVFRRRGLEPLIACDLAERRPGGIYVRGCERRHGWIKQRVKAGEKRAATGERDENGRFKKGVVEEKSSSDPPAAAGSLDQRRSSGGPAEPAAAGSLDQPFFLSLKRDVTCSVSFREESANPQAHKQPWDTEAPPPEVADFGEPAPTGRGANKYEPWHLELAEWLRRTVDRKNPFAERIDKADLPRWANELRLMTETDEVPREELLAVLGWTFELDSAKWRLIIQSPSGLRSNWARLRAAWRQAELKRGAALPAHAVDETMGTAENAH